MIFKPLKCLIFKFNFVSYAFTLSMTTNLHRDGLCYNTMMCNVNTSQIKMWVRCHSGNGTKDKEEKGGVVI